MCSTGPSQFKCLRGYIPTSCYYHHPIGSINLTEMFVTSYSVTYCIYIPGIPGFCFHYYCAVYDECKYSDTFWLADRVRLFVHLPSHYHHCAKLSEDIELPVRCILSSV